MSTMTRRTMLLSTSATCLGVSSLPTLAAPSLTEEQFNLWQAEIDAMFEFFDVHSFTQQERQHALFVRPLLEHLGDEAIRDVLTYELPHHFHKRERLSLILSIKHSLRQQHKTDLRKQREHLNHHWSDEPLVSLRHLMTTGSRDDLRIALLCANARV